MGAGSKGQMLFAAWVVILLVITSKKVCAVDGDDSSKKTYIVQMSKSQQPSVFSTSQAWYYSTFSSLRETSLLTEELHDDVLHVYDSVFHGFAARLTAEEVNSLEAKAGVMRVHPEGIRQLDTTHTPQFLGLDSSTAPLLVMSESGEDVIIGVLDTGVWPERESFADEEMSAIPPRWKGGCVDEPTFSDSLCNKKVIGAKYYSRGYEASHGKINTSLEFKSPRDSEGHGTHTSSTCGGREVSKASLFGFANGTAKGVAPKARLAIYKICWETGCYDSDILAAFDAAVGDGVDVISLSVGGGVQPYYRDPIAIGAYGAVKKGVFVSCSGGNSGPGPLTVSNIAPWITTVAASTVDRTFPAVVKLGSGVSYEGISLYSGPGLGNDLLPLIWAGNASREGVSSYSASLCMDNTLDYAKIKGKIVLCDRGTNARVAKGGVCKSGGALGFVLRNLEVDGEGLLADAHVLPGSSIGAKAGASILEYILSTANPLAIITFGGTSLGVKPAPVVASFSSRGPNSETPQILKPDITAPGVNILAAWTGAAGPTGLEDDDRRVEFNIISGTSMSCPHISGVAALLKGARSAWSPAAIKSAIMTSAYVFDNAGGTITDEATGNTTTPYSYGAGHVSPETALDPGLVYDLEMSDYIAFLCAMNYSEGAVQLIDPDIPACPEPSSRGSPADLNYPSFSVVFDISDTSISSASFNRTVTNVGRSDSTYTVNWVAPLGVDIVVSPKTLHFSSAGEKLTYSVNVVADSVTLADSVSLAPEIVKSSFGYLAWTSKFDSHVVQSPIVVNWIHKRQRSEIASY